MVGVEGDDAPQLRGRRRQLPLLGPRLGERDARLEVVRVARDQLLLEPAGALRVAGQTRLQRPRLGGQAAARPLEPAERLAHRRERAVVVAERLLRVGEAHPGRREGGVGRRRAALSAGSALSGSPRKRCPTPSA